MTFLSLRRDAKGKEGTKRGRKVFVVIVHSVVFVWWLSHV